MIVLLATTSHAQVKKYTGITRYDFSVYQGYPIKTGWLMSDSLYRVVYHYSVLTDSLLIPIQKLNSSFNRVRLEYETLKLKLEMKSDSDTQMIADQQRTINGLNVLLLSSTDNNKKILSQFWILGKAGIRIHKATAITVGVSVGILGYMVGKTF